MKHIITVEPVGREVECREDQTILDACLRNGVWLPHSCTHGTCATCKSDRLDGDVDHGEASGFALMDFERDEKLLTCCARPRSDVTIEADIDVDEDMEIFPVDDYTGIVTAVADIATETRRLVVELDREICFNAGQYMKFVVPADASGGGEVDRTWSIGSPPRESPTLEFHVRNVPGGRGTEGWVFSRLAVGDRVRLSGPYGRFVLRTGDDRHAIMVGGGTGVAPLKSMIRHALESGDHPGEITLYAGGRGRDWLYDVPDFRALEAAHDRFTFHPCLSEETAEEVAIAGEDPDAYRYGVVTDVIAADHDRLTGCTGYLCGPPAMVDAALRTFMGLRLFPRDIYREDFFNEADKAGVGVKSPLIKR